MSNGYNDYKNDMESCVRYNKDKTINAIQYLPYLDNADAIEYQYCDFLCNDVKEIKVKELQYESLLPTTILQLDVGNEYDNYDGTWTKEYEYTLYVKPGDWVVFEKNRLFVVKDEYISQYVKV